MAVLIESSIGDDGRSSASVLAVARGDALTRARNCLEGKAESDREKLLRVQWNTHGYKA